MRARDRRRLRDAHRLHAAPARRRLDDRAGMHLDAQRAARSAAGDSARTSTTAAQRDAGGVQREHRFVGFVDC